MSILFVLNMDNPEIKIPVSHAEQAKIFFTIETHSMSIFYCFL